MLKEWLFKSKQSKVGGKTMITLSYRQPWPTLVALGLKPIENRTWELPKKYKGQRVLIHASGKPWSWKQFCDYIEQLDNEDLELQKIIRENNFSEKWIKSLPTSAIIGSVVISDCVINHPSIWAEKTHMAKLGEYELPSCLYPPYKPVYNWVLSNPILFDEPILNIKGRLNFWKYEPDVLSNDLFNHVWEDDFYLTK